jgi:hypothetical protein
MTSDQHTDQEIGPRRPGTRWRSHYWGDEVTVLDVHRPDGDRPWSITEATDDEQARGRSRTHCTPWDPRDEVLS